MQSDDKVWFDLRNRLAGIANEVKELRSSHNVLVLAHFSETLRAVESSLNSVDVKFQTFTLFDSSMICSGLASGNVMVGMARALQPANVLLQQGHSTVRVIVAEHHPKATNDQHIIDIVEKLPCHAEVQFHTSLDDPLLRHFGGDKLISLVKILGMSESESIEHRFVTSAIRTAQEKLEELVPREFPTESIADWFRFNLRSG